MKSTLTPAGQGTQAIDRAARLLVAVVESEGPRTLGELATATALPKSTASRLVGALERQGLVQRADAGRLEPGPVLVRYARRDAGLDLAALAGPPLRALAERTGETVNLAVPASWGPEQLAQVESSYLLGATNWVGRRVPHHASAQGKVFLAFGAAILDGAPLVRLTSRTVVDPARLADELAQVRQRGYATTVGELEPGLVAVAAGVRDRAGAVVASVAVSGPSTRLGREERERIGEDLLAVADELSALLGSADEKGAA